MSSLQPAHRGYEYQDLLVAARSVDLVLGTLIEALADEKVVKDDRFDDLTTTDADGARERVQFKHTDNEGQALSLATFTSDSRQLKLDRLIACAIADRDGPGASADSLSLRIVLRDSRPTDATLMQYLRPDSEDRGPFLAGMTTYRLRFDANAVWPEYAIPPDDPDSFSFLRTVPGLTRADVVWVLHRLTVEVEAPAMTGALGAPGDAETILLDRVSNELGAGQYPNEHRAPVDVAESLVSAARIARQGRIRLSRFELLDRSQLRIDFGSVAHINPVQAALEVPRSTVISYFAAAALESSKAAVPMILEGPPGQGKSWTCKQLVDHLSNEGWLVAEHYCFLGAADNEREARVYTDHIFGTLLDKIAETEPALVIDQRPRFAASQQALEQAVKRSLRDHPDRPVALVVDGLDHVSRVSPHSRATDPSRQLAEELAALDLPSGCVLIVLSQPGDHLLPLVNTGATTTIVQGFSRSETAELLEGLEVVPNSSHYELDSSELVDAIHLRSGGNALYSTYLSREVRLREIPASDALTTVNSLPAYDGSLAAYYEHLYTALGDNAAWVADLLPFLTFAITPAEIKEIRPDGAHRVEHALKLLSPVLNTNENDSGLRVYHESFARFIADQFDEQTRVAINERIATWLLHKGFYTDERAYRFLLPVLSAAGRHREVLELVEVPFLAKSVAAAFPPSAILSNIVAAIGSATRISDWPSVVRFIELARGASTFEYERLETVMVDFADIPIAVIGGEQIANRLLFEGHTVVPARSGLQICAALDSLGVPAPWAPYINAYFRDTETDNTHYGADSDADVLVAILRGRLRLQSSGRTVTTAPQADAAEEAIGWVGDIASLRKLVHYIDEAELPSAGVAQAVLDTQGPTATFAVASRLAVPAPFALAAASSLSRSSVQDPAQYSRFIDLAAGPGRENGTIRALLNLGASLEAIATGSIADRRSRLLDLTEAVQHESGFETQIEEWLDLCVIAALLDPVTLAAAEGSINGEFWYRNWLRFAIGVARAEASEEDLRSENALDAIQLLGVELDPFAGNPRACDLFPIWKQVRETIRRAVDLLDDVSWPEGIKLLTTVSNSISTSLFGEMGGPFATDDLLRLVIDTGSTSERRETMTALIKEVIDDDSGGRFYTDLAVHRLVAARAALRLADLDGAEGWWIEACQLLTGYGFHKDITIFELLDPLPALIKASPAEGRERVAVIQPLVERIPAHTDRKETRHAWPRWWDLLALADPVALANLVSPVLLANCNLPKAFHDEARAELWSVWQGSADPVLASLLRTTLDVPLEPNDHSGLERLLRTSGLPACLPNLVVSLADGRASSYSNSNASELLRRDADRIAAINSVATSSGAPVITPWTASDSSPQPARDEASSHAPATGTNARVPALDEKVDIPEGLLGLARAARAWRRRPYDATSPSWDVARFANAIGYRLLELVQEGRQGDADLALRTIVEADRFRSENELLALLATGLERHGLKQLAAMAFAFAWTRSRGGGGWLTFGGETAIGDLGRALELDSDETLSVLTEEIQRTVPNGSLGTTQAVIYAFTLINVPLPNIEKNSLEIAFEAWDQAAAVIASRAPRVHAWDDPDEPYLQPDGDDGSPYLGNIDRAFALAIVAGIATPGRERKRAALLSVQMLLDYAPTIAGEALQELLPSLTDAVTLSWILRLIETATSREDILRSCNRVISDLTDSDLLTVRALARRLNTSASGSPLPSPAPDEALIEPPRSGALWLPSGVRESDSDDGVAAELERIAGIRMTQGEVLLPRLRVAVTKRVRAATASKAFRARMKSQFDHAGRADGIPDAILAFDEVVEKAIQEVAGGGRLAMLANGSPVLNPSQWEDELAELLLNDPIGPLAIESTRHPRPPIPVPPGQDSPEWVDLLRELDGERTDSSYAPSFDHVFRLDPPGVLFATVSRGSETCVELKGGEYDGWRIIGSEERRWIPSTGRDDARKLVQRYFGLEFRGDGDEQRLEHPPLAFVSTELWSLPLPRVRIAGSIVARAPLVGHDDEMLEFLEAKKGLGTPERLMVPTAWMREEFQLSPVAPFALGDARGPALGLLTWRTDYERSDYHLPRPNLSGSAIAVRPDLLERLETEFSMELLVRDFIAGPSTIVERLDL